MESKNDRTSKVLEKWGMSGDENDLNKEDIKKAAEMYAKIKIQNKTLKRFAFGGLFVAVVFLGLMLASVIIGAEISKDFKVKNEALVQKSGNVVLGTSEMYYSMKMNLTTPLSVIKGIKSLKLNNKDGSTIQFSVVSFYYIHGRKLTFYGYTHMANVLGDGTIEVYPISSVNGQKRIDQTRMVRGDAEDLLAMTVESAYGTGITPIYDCDGLQNIGSTGKYALLNNINCVLSAPLLPNGFFGTFNGHGFTITLTMNVSGPAALFAKVGDGALFANLFINGNIVGNGNCSAFAIEAYKGAKFLSCAVYANVTCNAVNDDFTALGGFAAVLRNPAGTGTGRVSFYYSVNQGNFKIISNGNKISYTGGSYGRTGYGEAVQTSFNYTYSASLLSKFTNSSRVNRFGFKYSFPIDSSSSRSEEERAIEKRDPYIPEDCYNFNVTNPDYINMCVEWYSIHYYENYDCCSDFNSCPYLYCDPYVQGCIYCPYGKRSEESNTGITHNGIGNLIVPTNRKLCNF